MIGQVHDGRAGQRQREGGSVQAVADQAVVHQGREASAGAADLGGAFELGVDVGGGKGKLLGGSTVHHGQRRAEFMVDHVEELPLLQSQRAFAVQRRLQRVLRPQQLGRAQPHALFQRMLGFGQGFEQLCLACHGVPKFLDQAGADGHGDHDVDQQGVELPENAGLYGGQAGKAHIGCRHIQPHEPVHGAGNDHQHMDQAGTIAQQIAPCDHRKQRANGPGRADPYPGPVLVAAERDAWQAQQRDDSQGEQGPVHAPPACVAGQQLAHLPSQGGGKHQGAKADAQMTPVRQMVGQPDLQVAPAAGAMDQYGDGCHGHGGQFAQPQGQGCPDDQQGQHEVDALVDARCPFHGRELRHQTAAAPDRGVQLHGA
ncbi:MAG: hypothetical protein GAK34_03111 [Delftia tsuruhatensis]|nr:MAG: hypothetical protein GAK34_03111 [Delftia tsuruhatensis]